MGKTRRVKCRRKRGGTKKHSPKRHSPKRHSPKRHSPKRHSPTGPEVKKFLASHPAFASQIGLNVHAKSFKHKN